MPALLRSLAAYVQRDIVHDSEPPHAPAVPVATEPIAELPADTPPVAAVPAADEPPASTATAQPDEVSLGDPNAEGYITEAGVRVFKPAGTTYTQNADGTLTMTDWLSHGNASVTGSAQSLGLTNTVSPAQRRVNYHNTANALAVSSPLGGVIGDTMMATGDFVGAAPDIPDSITSGVDWTSTGASAGTTTGLFGNVVDTASSETPDLRASDAGYASQMVWLDSLGGKAGGTTTDESSLDAGSPQRDPVDTSTNSGSVGNAVGSSLASASESGSPASGEPQELARSGGAAAQAVAPLTFEQAYAAGQAATPVGGMPPFPYSAITASDVSVDTTPGQINVGPGENLSSIAAKWAGDNASRGQVNDLKNQFIAANPDIDPASLQPGQPLNYPQAGTLVDAATYSRARDADIANIVNHLAISIPAMVVDQPDNSDAMAIAQLAIALQKPAGLGDPGVDYDPAYLARINSGPQLVPYDANVAAAQAAQQQYDANSLVINLAGPVLGAGGAYAKAFGASANTVSALTESSTLAGLALAGIPEAGSVSLSPVRTPLVPILSGGTIIGTPEVPGANASAEMVRSLMRQNEALTDLSSYFDVMQLPNSGQRHADGSTNPDAAINGQLVDVYSPGSGSLRTIQDNIQTKLEKQAPNLVLNLADSPHSAGQVLDYLDTWPVNANNLIILKNGKWTMSPSTVGTPWPRSSPIPVLPSSSAAITPGG